MALEVGESAAGCGRVGGVIIWRGWGIYYGSGGLEEQFCPNTRRRHEASRGVLNVQLTKQAMQMDYFLIHQLNNLLI